LVGMHGSPLRLTGSIPKPWKLNESRWASRRIRRNFGALTECDAFGFAADRRLGRPRQQGCDVASDAAGCVHDAVDDSSVIGDPGGFAQRKLSFEAGQKTA